MKTASVFSVTLGIFLCLLWVIPPVQAQENPADTEVSEETTAWELYLMPYLWAASLDADSTVKGNDAEIDMSFSDIFDVLDIAFIGYAEVRRGRAFFITNALYMELSEDAELSIQREKLIGSRLPPRFPRVRGSLDLEVDAEVTAAIMELFAGYRFYEHEYEDTDGDGELRKLGIDGYGGIRYTRMEVDLDVDATVSVIPPGPIVPPFTVKASQDIDQDEDWIDPVVGVRVQYDLLDNLRLSLLGDVGGFGVGSDFAWSATALASWRLTRHFSLLGGYRILEFDYETGSGDDKFAMDATMQGPVLGAVFSFEF